PRPTPHPAHPVNDTPDQTDTPPANEPDQALLEVWEHWNTREGRETYAYMTVDTLLATFAVSSTESNQDNRTVLMPVQVEDVIQRDRSYYNRYLRRALPNPLRDAKQLVLFSNIPHTDSDALQSAMHSVQQWCSRANLARMYSAVNTGG
ncbi:hypothetical protein, partial [Streptomyces lydicus]|uniref:hypothetical protein n=1 Tax=Streptomyces lydicus TaxID=47763 RepID=UPI00379E85BD